MLARGAAALAADMAGDAAEARRLLDEAEAVAKTVGATPVTLGLPHGRAVNGLFNGDLETARSASLEGVRLSIDCSSLKKVPTGA